jgi:hypothetical protein
MKALDVLRFPPSGPGSLLARVGQYFLQNGLVVKNKTIAYSEFYHQAAVAVTNITFFQGTPDSVGAGQNTNLDTFIRPQYEHMLITQVKFYAGAAATLEATDWESGLSSAELKNGQFSITTNNNTVVKNMPLTTQMDYAAAGDGDSGYMLPVPPVIWAGQNDIAVECVFPVAPATSNQNLRVVLCGYAAI